MSYRVDSVVELGKEKAGLSVRATIKTMAGVLVQANVGPFPEDPVGEGCYWWSYDGFADGESYRLIFLAAGVFVGALAVGPMDGAMVLDVDALAGSNWGLGRWSKAVGT